MDPIPFFFQILLPALWQGLILTIALVLLTAPFGLLLGTAIALGRQYGGRGLSGLCAAYVVFFKGCPLLLLLFIIYFGLPSVGITLPAFAAAVLGFILCNAAYNSEYIRGAVLSIRDGQMTAALSLGMTKWTAISCIILPQALRISLPGWSNEYPEVLTDSAVCYAIGVMELLTRTSQIVSQTYVTMPVYLACALIFIALNYAGMEVIRRVTDHFAVPGFGAKAVQA